MSDLDVLVRKLQAAATRLARLERSARRPKLHKKPDAFALARAVAKMPTPPPADYLAFLMAHDGWDLFWEGFTIAGVAGPAREEIAVSVREAVAALRSPEAFEPKRLFTRREEDNPKFVYLPNHIVFATNMSGRLALFDRRTRDADGDMQVALFAHSGGVYRRFESFRHFLSSALASTEARIAGKPEPPVRRDEDVFAERKAMLLALKALGDSRPPPPLAPKKAKGARKKK